MSCEVCISKFNQTTRARVSCPWCDYAVCRECTAQYIFSLSGDLQCMSCKREWNREHLCNFFPKQFMTKTYKQFRENVLFEREKALMPATQPLVEKEIKIRAALAEAAKFDKQKKLVAVKINKLLGMSNEEFCREYNHQFTTNLALRLAKVEALRPLNLESARLGMEISILEGISHTIRTTSDTVTAERAAFVRACPAAECRGFLSTAWKCGLCEIWVCSQCHEIKGHDKHAEHTCDPNSVATAELLAKDSKPCPKCAAMIFKIDGCDQMFCMQCKTAFSWKTRRIETGRIHNPHYYEYMRARGDLPREPGDVPCGGMPEMRQIMAMLRSRATDNPKIEIVSRIHRMHGHIAYHVIPRYQFNRHQCNEDLRVNYMLGEINEADFKFQIQKREKALQKKTEIAGVLHTYNDITGELIRGGLADVDKFLTEMGELAKFTNAALQKIAKHYTCVVPHINEKDFNI